MLKLFAAIGLTYADMVDVLSHILIAISIGVCIGRTIYECISCIMDFFGSLLVLLCRFVKKQFCKRQKADEKVMTNGDRIRNMSDEELADSMVSGELDVCIHCEFYDPLTTRCMPDNPCVKELAYAVFLDWLKSKAFSERSENTENV